MNTETNELMEYLFRIAKKSLHGEIPWNQPNPSTFQWVQDNDGDYFFVTIQKAIKPGLKGLKAFTGQDDGIDQVYLFQVQDRKTKQTVLSLSTKERPEVFEALAEIYYSAEKGMDVRATSVLRRLLSE